MEFCSVFKSFKYVISLSLLPIHTYDISSMNLSNLVKVLLKIGKYVFFQNIFTHQIACKCRHRNKYTLVSYDSMDWNVRCKVEVSWNYEIFGACDNLIYCSCEADWQKFHLFQYILRIDVFYVTYIAHTFSPLFTWIPFTGVKRIFLHLVLWRHLKYETIVL